MPRMLITPLGRSRLYLRRDMIAEDGTAEIEPQCLEAARVLGYVEDPPDAMPAPALRRRGRPPKAAAPEAAGGSVKADEYEPTRDELLEEAKELGLELPSGYVKKDDLAELIEEAKTDDEES